MTHIANFLRIWIWFSLRQFRHRFWRAVAVLLGIGLGAAVFTSVRLAVDASVGAFSESVDRLTGKTEWRVVMPGGRVPEDEVPALLLHPTVRAASPVITAWVRAEGYPEPFLLIGLDPILDRPLRDWRPESDGQGTAGSLSWSRLMAEPGTVMLGRNLAARLRAEPGDRFVFSSGRAEGEVSVAGIMAAEGLALAEGGRIAVADIATVQELLGLHGLVDRIDLALRSKASPEALRAVLPHGLALERPSEVREAGLGMIRAYETNLTVLSFVSLFVGMFLVYSLVSLNGASRRRELAILRSVGASPRLVFLVFLTDGALLGLLGWLAAIPAAAFLVRGLVAGVSSTVSTLFVRVAVEGASLTSGEIALSFCLTMVVALLAAWQPAREAMAVAPREALLMPGEISPGRRRSGRASLAGLAMLALARPVSLLPGPRDVPIPGYLAVFLLFAGFSLLAPTALRLMGRTLPDGLGRAFGWPAWLAGRYLRDARARTAVSVGALVTAMALFTALSIMIHSFRTTFNAWLDQSVSGDLFIRVAGAEENEYRESIPDAVRRTLENRPGLDVMAYNRLYLRHGGIPYQLEPLDAEVQVRHGAFLFVRGDPAHALPAFIAGQGVLVSETFANRTGVDLGDRYRANAAATELDLPVVGVVRSYRTRGGVVFISRDAFMEWTGPLPWGGARIFFHDRADAEARARELADELLAATPGLEATPGPALRSEIVRIFDETFAVTTVLLLIALAVAALGITTTLTVLVLERSRQIVTMLAVGASRGQIRAMVLWEAGLLALAGEILGLACGFLLSVILVHDINRVSFGWTFVYTVDTTAIAVSLPLVLLAAMAAAVPAGRLAIIQPPALVLRER